MLVPNFFTSLNQMGGKLLEFLEPNSITPIPKTLEEFLQSKKPRFLINAAGYTGKPNVDACELAKADCLNGNAVLPGTIRQVCEDLKITWGHVSSGCIFSGRRPDGGGWTEMTS